MQKILFHRDFRRFQGGHLKVWDYFCHARTLPDTVVEIYFTPESVWDDTNPWAGAKTSNSFNPEAADVLFLAGMDWQAVLPTLQRSTRRPATINLIQHVRHADPSQSLYHFLREPAVRICVSAAVADALRGTGVVNGPIVAIPNGVSLPDVGTTTSWQQRDIDVLVVGIKQRAQARALMPELAPGVHAVAVLDSVPRHDFLRLMARSRATVFLPDATEGFYLPALEGMILGTLVICPDALGNRGFCEDGVTCFMPTRDSTSLAAAVHRALGLSAPVRQAMLDRSAERARWFDLGRERDAFHAVIRDLPALWRQATHNPRPA